jgi:LysR family transcriptional regulator of abg operon
MPSSCGKATRCSGHERFFDPGRRRTRVETIFDRTNFAFRSNSLAACVDYALSTDAALQHTHVMRENFAQRGLFEVEQSQEPRHAITGIYMLRERRGEERIEDLIERITKACHAVLPPLN